MIVRRFRTLSFVLPLTSALVIAATSNACGDDDDDTGGGSGASGAAGQSGGSGTGGSAGNAGGPGGSAGGGGAGAEPTLTEAVETFCQALKRREERCDVGSPIDLDACRADWTCRGEGLRATYIAALSTCVDGLACGMSDDGCSPVAAATLDASAHQAFLMPCLAKAATCGQAGAGGAPGGSASAEGQCRLYASAALPSFLDGPMNGCIASACDGDAFEDCVSNAFDTLSCD
jgi:hypothetical protein